MGDGRRCDADKSVVIVAKTVLARCLLMRADAVRTCQGKLSAKVPKETVLDQTVQQYWPARFVPEEDSLSCIAALEHIIRFYGRF